MTRTIKSFTSNAHYFLTIDDATGQAVDCACPDHQYRGRTCKHMSGFNQEVIRAEAFNRLMAKFDVRSDAVKAARREAYCVDFAIYG